MNGSLILRGSVCISKGSVFVLFYLSSMITFKHLIGRKNTSHFIGLVIKYVFDII